MKNSVLIRKDGKFYHVFNDDAYIFNYLFKNHHLHRGAN